MAALRDIIKFKFTNLTLFQYKLDRNANYQDDKYTKNVIQP